MSDTKKDTIVDAHDSTNFELYPLNGDVVGRMTIHPTKCPLFALSDSVQKYLQDNNAFYDGTCVRGTVDDKDICAFFQYFDSQRNRIYCSVDRDAIDAEEDIAERDQLTKEETALKEWITNNPVGTYVTTSMGDTGTITEYTDTTAFTLTKDNGETIDVIIDYDNDTIKLI
jgi:hypothetical protein